MKIAERYAKMGLDGGEAKSSFFLERINQVKIR
jgi:hypothetical protein